MTKKCECINRYPAEINSLTLFKEIKAFFEEQVLLGIYDDISVIKPYYCWKTEGNYVEWYADKWYICRICNCLLEFQYPDFPVKGKVRKFVDGQYKGEE